MKYQPPFVYGATPAVAGIYNADANASYVNGDPSLGQEGSYFPGEAIEHGQREIVAAIVASGLTPDHTVLTQLRQAIARSASGATWFACVGTANAYTLSATAAFDVPTAPFDGQMLRFVPNHTNDGPATATVGGVTKSIRSFDDAALIGGELVLGRPTEAVFDSVANGGAGAVLLMPWTSAVPLQSFAAAIFSPSRQIFSTPGAYSWTVPAGVSAVRARLWGGGGGGGYANNPGGAAGGGGGAYLEVGFAVADGDTISGSVAAGGTAGVSGANGTAGGSTTLTHAATTHTAPGGAGGINVSGDVSNSAAGGAMPASGYIARAGEPSHGGSRGYSGSGVLYYGGNGGAAPSGGYGGRAGTGPANSGAAPGGACGGGANGDAAGAGARGEVWIEYMTL